MMTISRNFLKELECPVCFNYLISPIKLCINGHSICDCCKELQQCPTCRAKLTNARNLILENIATGFTYPCIYQKEGCNEMLALDAIKEHEAVCPMKISECPVSKFPGIQCSWTGRISDLKMHMNKTKIESHGNILEMIFDSAATSTKMRTVFVWNEVFLYYKLKKNGKWYFVVMLVGTKAQASMYKSVLTFKEADGGLNSIICTHDVKHYGEDFETIIESSNCPQFDDAVMRKFIKGVDELQLTVEISRYIK